MLIRWLFSLAFALTCYSFPVVADEDDSQNIIASESFTYNADFPPPLGLPESTESRGVGPLDAPVKAVLFFGIECNTCATYWKTVRPKLLELAAKKKLRIYFQETYVMESGWTANLYLRCMPQTEHIKLVEQLLSDQVQWIAGGDLQISYLRSLTAAMHQDWPKIKTCIANTDHQRQLRKDHDQMFIYYGITKVPVLQVLNTLYRFGERVDDKAVESLILSLAEAQAGGH